MADKKPLLVQYQKLCQRCLYCEDEVTIVRVTLTPNGGLYVATLCEECAKGEMSVEVVRHGLSHLGGGTFIATDFDWSMVEHLVRRHLEPVEPSLTDKN